MADDPARKKYKAKYFDSLNPQSAEPTRTVSERRMELWNALSKYIHANGGAVTSIPGHSALRIEVERGSALPTKLAAYDPRHIGMTTRITCGKFDRVDIIEIVLPGK
jgi:hypothetical protein